MWQPEHYVLCSMFTKEASRRAAALPELPLSPAVSRLRRFVSESPLMHMLFTQMFEDRPLKASLWADSTDGGGIADRGMLFSALNYVISKPPQWDTAVADKGLIGVPMFLLLKFALGTPRYVLVPLEVTADSSDSPDFEKWT